MGSINVQLVVRTDLTATGAIMNTDYAVRSDQVAILHGFPILTLIERRYLLPVALNNP
jgi:hypothetical protein